MKKLLFLIFIIGSLAVISGCAKEKSDRAILLEEIIPRIKEAFLKSDGNLYLEQISADAPLRKEFIDYAIKLDKKEVLKREIKIGEFNFYKEGDRELASLMVVEREDANEQICDYIFRKERLSWKLFERNCEE